MSTIVFSATGHVDCAFVFAAYKMRSDATIAARSVVDIVDKVSNEVETSLRYEPLLNLAVVVLSGGHTCDRRHRRRKCAATMVFGLFLKDCRCRVRESSQVVAIFAAIEVTQSVDAGSWCCK
jgi:hypothetical protein